MSWFRKIFNKPSTESEDILQVFSAQMADIKRAGQVNGGHYTDSVERVRSLKREGKYSEAIELLLKCVDATEREAKSANYQPSVLDERFDFLGNGRLEGGWGVAPWYYEQLAILYRKEKLYRKEVEILERYEKQEKAPGIGPKKLSERLMKAKELAKKYA